MNALATHADPAETRGRPRAPKARVTCGAIPTLGEEDARRPNRERENLLGERTRIGARGGELPPQ